MSVNVEVEKIKHETDEAMLVELPDEREIWVPFSQVSRTERRRDGSATLTVSDWFANKEDLG